jgi:hypothetical protein
MFSTFNTSSYCLTIENATSFSTSCPGSFDVSAVAAMNYEDTSARSYF